MITDDLADVLDKEEFGSFTFAILLYRERSELFFLWCEMNGNKRGGKEQSLCSLTSSK